MVYEKRGLLGQQIILGGLTEKNDFPIIWKNKISHLLFWFFGEKLPNTRY